MIIDAHTHAFPAAAVEDPGSWAEAHNELHWRDLVLPSKGKASLQGWVKNHSFPEFMDRDNIDRCVLLGWYWETPKTCDLHNQEMGESLQNFPDRFSALAAVHPDGPSPDRLVSWALENRFAGFGELHPTVQGSSLQDPFWSELANRASEAGLVFNFHVTEPIGRKHTGRIPTSFEDFLHFIENHPKLKIILSHWGGGLFLYELNPYVRQRFQNVTYDTSASPLLYGPKIFSTALDIVGAEKILFGSDFPLKLYPRKKDQPGWKRFLDDIQAQKIAPGDTDSILGGNAQQLFGLDR